MRGRGLEAAGERAVGEAAEVEVVDLVAVLADDLADQARAPGRCAAGRTRRTGTRATPPTAPMTRLAAVGDVEAGRAELAEGLAVLVGQPEQLADHQERDREREGLDQVDDAVVLGGDPLGLVELLLDDPVDRRLAAAPAGAS